MDESPKFTGASRNTDILQLSARKEVLQEVSYAAKWTKRVQ